MATKADFDRLGAWAVILNPDLNIDRRKCHRKVPMEVLSLGAPRTGTLTMREAYEILGYANPYHYASIFENCKDSDMWIDALDAKFRPGSGKKAFGKAEFDKLLGHSGAITDVPAIIFWRELMEAYPEAKIVLVSRDEEKWLKSMKGLVSGILNPVGRYVLRNTDPSRTGRILNLGMAWIKDWFGVQGSLSVDKVMKRARGTYRSHYADIRATVPKEKLLEYELGSGWEPLCKFLGKDVPNVPFPNRNDAATLDLAFGVFLKAAFLVSLRNLAGVGIIGVLLYYGIAWQRIAK